MSEPFWEPLAAAPSAPDAAALASAPTGDVAATNVQAAIAELAAEKQAISAKGAASGYASLDSGVRLPNAQLPLRLREGVYLNPLADCNLAVENGWYEVINTTANKPPIDYSMMRVESWGNNSHYRQTAYHYSSDQVYHRRCTAGVWGAWKLVWQGRHVEGGKAAVDGSGNVSVTFADPFVSNPNVATSLDAANISGHSGLSTTGVTLHSRTTAGGSAGGTVNFVAEGPD